MSSTAFGALASPSLLGVECLHSFVSSLIPGSWLSHLSAQAYARSPQSLLTGMNAFLKNLDITFRRDPTNFRPRINKLDSVKDHEQKVAGDVPADCRLSQHMRRLSVARSPSTLTRAAPAGTYYYIDDAAH